MRHILCQRRSLLINFHQVDRFKGVSESMAIPVRLDHEVVKRLDEAAQRLGNTRAGIIKLCVVAFLDYFEETGSVSMPLNWNDMAKYLDRRTVRSRGAKPGSSFSTAADSGYMFNDKSGSGSADSPGPASAKSRKPAVPGKGRSK